MISGYLSCKFAAQPGKIESSIDLAHQMIFGDCVIELKLVEKLPLFALQPSHHGLPLPRFASARWHHGSPQASTDFCNKICQRQTPRNSMRQRTCLHANGTAFQYPVSDRPQALPSVGRVSNFIHTAVTNRRKVTASRVTGGSFAQRGLHRR